MLTLALSRGWSGHSPVRMPVEHVKSAVPKAGSQEKPSGTDISNKRRLNNHDQINLDTSITEWYFARQNGSGSVASGWPHQSAIDYAIKSYPMEKAMKNKTVVFASLILSIFCGGTAMAGDFQPVPASNFPNVAYGNLAWGDYDNDGRLDVLITGNQSSSSPAVPVAKLFHNDGGNVFSEVLTASNLVPVWSSSVAWGDYDNDGFLDLIVTGLKNSSVTVTKIYHNQNGSGLFQDIDPANTLNNLPGICSGSVAWGDYNNDGLLDLLFSGAHANSFSPVTRLYRNVGNNKFIQELNATNLPPAQGASLAWGDYDNDGYLDIALVGRTVYSPTTYTMQVFHNDGGNGYFSSVGTGALSLGASQSGSVDWGDYDNDGYLDILVSGSVNMGGVLLITKVYHNDIGLGGTFSENTSAGLPGIGSGRATWGDFNNDGYLDILAVGAHFARIYINDGSGSKFTAFINDANAGLTGASYANATWGDYDNDGRLDILLCGTLDYSNVPFTQLYKNILSVNPNTVPTVPTGLAYSISAPYGTPAKYDVTLSWQKSFDLETQQANGLNYNLFIGTSSNPVGTLSPMAQLNDGWRRIVALGPKRADPNSSEGNWTIIGLSVGTYFLGVQAIDAAFAGSPFAIGSFTLGACTIEGDTYMMFGLPPKPMPKVKVTANGMLNGSSYIATTESDMTGHYVLSLPVSWSGRVVASKPDFIFQPAARYYEYISVNQTGQDYLTGRQ